MKIQYASDFHLEFAANTSVLAAAPLRPVGDVLLLMEAGGSVFQFPAPTEGRVKKLCAAEGDAVEAGQVLVILEEKEGEADA